MKLGLKTNPHQSLRYYTESLPTKPSGFSKPGQAKTNRAKLTLRQFIKSIHPYREWPDYAYQLFDVLERVANGEIDRLMVYMPPRHFKSEIVSRLFSAYFLYKNPDKWVGLCSYAAGLSYTLSRNARDNYQRAGGALKDDAAAVSHWETGKGGGLWAAGVGGPATGKGFHLGIIDDPIKNSEEAQSPVIQTRNNDWYDSTFSTRQEPGAAIVLIQTRWTQRDTAGYLLEKEIDEPENWHIVHFEAIKGKDAPAYPVTCTLEQDKRKPGEALNPQRYPVEKLEKISRRIGDFFWNALYQQAPTLRSGRVYHAFTEEGPDASELDLTEADGFYHSHDFGIVNAVWGLWAKIKGRFYLIYEQQLPESTTAAKAEIIKGRTDGLRIIAGYGGAKSEDRQRLDYSRQGIRIRLPNITELEPQINAANQMLESGKMVICANCVNTIYQMQTCVRDKDGKIAEKSTWHYLDMVRYFAAGVTNDFVIGPIYGAAKGW